jgi:O-methyltransferase involved in polyketide biosynthesis
MESATKKAIAAETHPLRSQGMIKGGVAERGRAAEPFDPAKPNIARIWDYWLGGKENFAADRELAQKMLAVHPVSAQMARQNRQFLGRAVSYVAARGIGQFIDVGAGLPTELNTHDIARRINPEARVAYVDNDPVVISHARNLLAKDPGVIAVPGDMRDPGRILADAGLAELIETAEPACVILSGVLHFADAGTARDVAAAFAGVIVPGSYLIISVGSGNQSEGDNFTSAYTAARIHIHSLEEILSFFGGLELVPPGVVSVRCWYGDGPAPNLKPRTATFLGGVARKP